MRPLAVILCAFALVGRAGAAPAFEVEQVVRVDPSLTGSVPLRFERAASVAPFPGARLAGARFTFDLTVSGGAFRVDNDGPDRGDVSALFAVRARAFPEGIAVPALSTVATNDAIFELAPDDEHVSGAPVFSGDGGADEGVMLPLDRVLSRSVRDVSDAGLTLFEGTAPFSMVVDVRNTFDISVGVTNAAGSFETLRVDAVSLTVSYTYVPGPGALACAGACAFAACHRVRRGRA